MNRKEEESNGQFKGNLASLHDETFITRNLAVNMALNTLTKQTDHLANVGTFARRIFVAQCHTIRTFFFCAKI